MHGEVSHARIDLDSEQIHRMPTTDAFITENRRDIDRGHCSGGLVANGGMLVRGGIIEEEF